MNAKTAKKIRKLARNSAIFPNVEADTSYDLKRHKPRWGSRTAMKEIEHPETGEKITRPTTEPFRVNTNEHRVSTKCLRGIVLLLKKAFNNPDMQGPLAQQLKAA